MSSLVRGYLSDLGRHLHMSPPQEREILNEIRGHVEDSAREMMDEGISQDDAISSAVSGLGPSEGVARQLYRVHTQGSWYHTSLAVLPHVLLSLMFALGLWTAPGWLAVLLLVAVVISIFGWRKGRPTWTYPWLGYCLVAPIVAWGLAMSTVGYGAWGVLTGGPLPLSIPIYVASFVYLAGSMWVVMSIVTRVAQRDWVMASLTVMPVPFLTYWFVLFYNEEGLMSAQGRLFQGVDASAAVVFLILAGATALFFRLGRRVVRVGLLLVTAPSMVILSWLSYRGGPGYMAVFTLAAMSLVVLLVPALLDERPRQTENHVFLIEDTG